MSSTGVQLAVTQASERVARVKASLAEALAEAPALAGAVDALLAPRADAAT